MKMLTGKLNIFFNLEASMKDHNPHDPVNIIGEAYEMLLEKTMHDLHVHDGIESSSPSESIHRVAIPSYAHTQEPHWIEEKKHQLKNSTLEYLKHAGDKTTIALRRLNLSRSTPDKPDKNQKKAPDKSHGN
jgi:hypothetical protein